MKKTFIKILGTILAVVVFFVAQYHIRKYYGIDPRTWFFVVYGISFVGFIAICYAFFSEIKRTEEYFKTHSFFDFIDDIIVDISQAKRKALRKVKPAIEKIYHSELYNLIIIVSAITSFTGIMYKLFFHNDFMARTTIYIIFLILMFCTFLDRILGAIVVEQKRKRELVYAGMWAFIFLTNFLEFIM